MDSKTIIGGTGAYSRHASDFYETPPEATEVLLRELMLPEDIAVWDPACGDGAICRVLIEHNLIPLATDIRQTAYPHMRPRDFLDMTPPEDAAWIITNPPFNRAEEFIIRAYSLRIPFAYLLKATFWNTKAHQRLFEGCPPSAIYPLTWRPAMAPVRGKSPTMDFCWTVWGKPCDNTVFKPLRRPT